MRIRSSPAAAFAAAVLVASAAFATVYSVSPREIAVGDSIDVSGTDFRLPATAWLDLGGRRIPLRVARGATDTHLTATLRAVPRGAQGDCMLLVRTRGTTKPSAFAGLSIPLPEVTGVSSSSVQAGEEFTVSGQHLGTHRGTVRMGTRRVKVTSWTGTEVTVRVPANMPDGPVLVWVSNECGAAAAHPVVTIGS